jgi:secondary thiamine-phosphate synthase enzyme
MISQQELQLPYYGRGIHLISDLIISEIKNNLPQQGLLNLFIQHTSAGLAINENADPDVRHDMQRDFDRIVGEQHLYYRHTMEGPDDMPSHTKSVLTGHSLTIPIRDGRLALGIWQGIYLCEFRDGKRSRRMLATIYS